MTGGLTAEFVYDENGQRIRKTSNGVVTNYTVQGKRIVHVHHSVFGNLHIYYDGDRPDAVNYNGTMYGYVYSLQGDVLGLRDSTGAFAVEYRYDAWGRPTSKTGPKANSLGTINPFRYRGYVLDEDVGLYYLRSRYYNPWWGRFISADSVLGQIGGLLQHNLFAYGLNDPVNYADVDGEFAISVWVTAGIIGAVFGAATQMVSNAMFGVEIWKGVAGAAIGGAVYNIVSMTGAGVVGAAYASAAVENTVNEILMYTSGENEVTSENISNSISTVIGASFIGGTAYLATGNIADVAVKVPYGKLSENVSALLAGKMLKQTMVQTAYNMSASPFTVSINNKIRENCFGQPTLLTD